MKKLVAIVLVLLAVFGSGCAKRVPFKEKKPMDNAALVYIYSIPSDTSDSEDTNEDMSYIVRIDGKKTNDRIMMNEYMEFNMKPGPITFSAVKNAALEKFIKLNLQAGHIYYMRITQADNDDFNFELVKPAIASNEIKNTGLVNSVAVDDDSIITQIIDPVMDDTTQTKTHHKAKKGYDAKLDEVQKAYRMKESGVITEEEYLKIKRDILTR